MDAMGRGAEVFVCVVFHTSNLRPEGYQAAYEFCKSWREAALPYKLLILDNQSEVEYDFLKELNYYQYFRVNDQLENGGITGAWNMLCKEAYNQGADIITGFADDVIINDSLVNLINATVDDNILYAPVTNEVPPFFNEQKSDYLRPGYIAESRNINGFWLSFTRSFWEQKQENGALFLEGKLPGGDFIDKWAGQELMLRVWENKYKTKGCIIGDCWLRHNKLRSWKKARAKYK